ncbi:1-acyl-sn-glycerol-3-phosphate acyltransferase [Pseudonocardia sp. S2-4]|uniref:1-acyl-sn-glycerol-3-phosphate acyltransferase n=1 Tax=Pseudonocardia humida TaxID=2800819 RepID=A0ABT1A051_9PSEU|nr:1-acyl-sn-glycerol-3-phosphate acyltransferase [Pseudonocardia humida]
MHPTAGTGWVPTSPCDARCASGGPATGPATWGRAAVRAAVTAVVLAMAAVTTPLLVLSPRPLRERWLRAVCGAVLAAIGVAVRLHHAGPPGRPFGGSGSLVVANHVSWIEVLALCSVAPVRMLAKRELSGWPVIGPVAAATGVLFIDRRSVRRLPRTVAEMAAALRSGHTVVAFPEGTTWCGAAAGPFRRAAFQAALEAGVPVRPVAVTLTSRGRTAPEAAFVGEQSLLHSIGRVLRLSAPACELTVLPALAPEGTRAELAARAAAAIAVATGIPHGDRRRRVLVPTRRAS